MPGYHPLLHPVTLGLPSSSFSHFFAETNPQLIHPFSNLVDNTDEAYSARTTPKLPKTPLPTRSCTESCTKIPHLPTTHPYSLISHFSRSPLIQPRRRHKKNGWFIVYC